MVLHYKKFLLVSLCSLFWVADQAARDYKPFFSYTNGLRALQRDAIIRGRYKRIPLAQRPDWRLFYLAALNQLDAKRTHQEMENCLQQELEDAVESFAYQVRVLLHEAKQHDVAIWKISSESGIVVKNLKNARQKSTFYGQSVVVEYRNGSLYINKHKVLLDQLAIEPVEGHLALNGIVYEGSLLVMKDKTKAYCVSQLDIESYICSVLRSESWAGWPVEVNKAFAIACRSYLVAKILLATRRGRSYHIKNSNIHQTYNGAHTKKTLQQAVDETRGVILTYNKKPVEAMFDSCCGGVIPAHVDGVDFKKAPYLARPYPCNYCKPCKIYSWQAEYPLHDVIHLMRKAGIHVNNIDAIAITQSDNAGLVTELSVTDGSKTYKLNGKQCYALFGKMKSFCFTLDQRKHSIVLAGRGYGHHLGLCQWGARRMLDHGASYKHILDFYYPDTEFMRLTTA